MFRVGVIGLGMGKSHAIGVRKAADALAKSGVPADDLPVLYALCDIDRDKLIRIGQELYVGDLYEDYRDMLDDPLLDAVIIASPDQDHRRMAEDALSAGKHVLCEKPLALTREDIEAIVRAAQSSEKTFMVGQICRFTPGFRQAKELIEKGEEDIIDVKPQFNCDHTWAMWFHDSDGNRIEVHQYTKRSFELIGRN